MKIKVTFKTPDALDYALEGVPEEGRDFAREQCARWIRFDECVTIEVDTNAGTAVVLPAR